MVSVIIGEGGSGGAIAIATANRVLMMEHAIYSVISPEGCASILWRSGEQAKEAAEALKLTAQDLLKLGVIDEIVPEPLGGAQRGKREAIEALGEVLERNLHELRKLDGHALRRDVESSRLLVTVEENSSQGGFGESVASHCRDEGVKMPHHLLLSLPSGFVEQGPRDLLLKELGLDAEGIAESVRRALGRKNYLAVSPGGRKQ